MVLMVMVYHDTYYVSESEPHHPKIDRGASGLALGCGLGLRRLFDVTQGPQVLDHCFVFGRSARGEALGYARFEGRDAALGVVGELFAIQ